jgi:hypothetical protein
VFVKRQDIIGRIGEIDENGQVVNELRPGDHVSLDNLRTGDFDEVVVDDKRSFRNTLAADIGDPLRVVVTRPDGTLVKQIDELEYEVEGLRGGNVPAGTPLTSLGEGLGLRRNTPSMRRLLGIAQTALEPGDPVNYARLYDTPLDVRPEGRRPINAMFYVTMGDNIVPAATGIAVGRAAGVIKHREIDPRYGVSQSQLLIDFHVVDAVEDQRYFANDPCHYDPRPVNFDIDDLSNGLHPDGIPRLAQIHPGEMCDGPGAPPICGACAPQPPLRATVHSDHGISGVRFPALSPKGQHAIDIPNPNAAFDASLMVVNQIGLFFRSNGTVLSDHPCLSKNDCRYCQGEADCPQIPAPTVVDPLAP